MYEAYFIIFLLFFFGLVFSEGFIAGTLVKTPHGYTAIENLSVGDLVICFDSDNNCVEKSIAHITSAHVSRYVILYIQDECVGASTDQQLYVEGVLQRWVVLSSLKVNDVLLTINSDPCLIIDVIKYVDEPKQVYCLSVQEHHNFFVSHAEICAHNFFPVGLLGISFVFGGGIEFAGITCGLAGLGSYLGYEWHKKNKKHAVSINSISFGGSMGPDDPEDEQEKKRNRDEKRANYKPLTNKEARELAKELGYTETKSHPCGDTHGKLVFTNGRSYISPDKYGHREVFGRFLIEWVSVLQRQVVI